MTTRFASSAMPPIAPIITLLFLPALIGIGRQVIWGNAWSYKLLALGLVLLCIEQTYMAIVDLQQISEVKQQVQDEQLRRFFWVTVSTIALELTGFYLAMRSLGWGAVLVLVSLVWFNALATIKLQPSNPEPIQQRKFLERLPVLIADVVGLMLVALWIAKIGPLWAASILLGMLLHYGLLKYALPILNRQSVEVQ
ncbi:MAG: hypothetical protein SFW36_13085 [Leptolyngbyaceae cyanobacterium bins.59]|nr:hypothetical protein [Leptolyngbyaceae cyanobacterium bins.59]